MANLLATGTYIALLMLLNLVSEGKLAMSSGALVRQGWNPEDVAPGVQVALWAASLLFGIIVLLMVFAVLLWRLCRDKSCRTAFLTELGTAPFDIRRFRDDYMRQSGRQAVRLYGAVMLLCSLAEAVGVPFATLPIVPQTLFFKSIIALMPLTGFVKKILVCIVVAGGNTVLFRYYQKHIVPCVYAKWATERMRVDPPDDG